MPVTIEELAVGDGAEVPTSLDVVVAVKYTGTFTAEGAAPKPLPGLPAAGQVIEIPLGVDIVVRGFEQGLLGMKVNGRRRITIPPDLGYGTSAIAGSGNSQLLPRDSTLVFEIELAG